MEILCYFDYDVMSNSILLITLVSRLWDKRKCWSVIGFFPPINKNIALLISSGERAVWQRFRRELLYSSSILHSSPVGRGEGIGGFCFFAIKFTYFLPPPLPGPLLYSGSPWFAVNFCNPPFLFCFRRLSCSPRSHGFRGDHLRPEPPAKFSDPPRG